MLRRLFALLLLTLLLGAGLWLWRTGQPPGPGDLKDWGRRLEDAKTATGVEAALALNRHLAGEPVRVTAHGGRVTLAGQVSDAGRKALALELAAAVPGVTAVDDALTLAAEEPAQPGDDRTLGQRLDDRALEAKVRLAFSLHRGLRGAEVEVEARRRVVRLTGVVSDADQRRLALRLAADVPGALQVVETLQTGP